MPKNLAAKVYAEIVERLTPDGALRDIHVLQTSMADWRRLIDFIELRKLNPIYTYGSNTLTPPVLIEDIFDRTPDDLTTLMTFRLEGMDYNCHFFGVEEIELDIDPRQIEVPIALDSLLDFMISLGRDLNKDIFLTDEGFDIIGSEAVICRYSCAGDELLLGAEPGSVSTRVRYGEDTVAPELELWIRTFWEFLGANVKGWANGLEVVGTGDLRELGSIRLCLVKVDQDVFVVAGSPVAERPNEWTTSGSTEFHTKTTGPAEAAELIAFELKKRC